MGDRGMWLAVLNTFVEDSLKPNIDKTVLKKELNTPYIRHICKMVDFDFEKLKLVVYLNLKNRGSICGQKEVDEKESYAQDAR